MCLNQPVSVDSPLPHRFLQSLYRVSAVSCADDAKGEYRSELDSHADSFVGGSNTIRIGPVQKLVTVSAFAPGYGAKDYGICTLGTVWTDPHSGEDYLLVIHQGIYLGDELKHSLVNPNQLRANGVRVDDCPTQFDPRSSHSIIIDDPEVTIPLHLHGIISYFHSRKPTEEDIQCLPRITLTGTADWDPRADTIANMATSAVTTSAPTQDEDPTHYIGAVRILRSRPLELEEGNLHDRLVSTVCVTPDTEVKEAVQIASIRQDPVAEEEKEYLFAPPPPTPVAVKSVVMNGTKPKISAEKLSRSWNISLPAAKRTLKVTTQAGLRNVFSPSERKVRLKAPWLKFPSINTRIYSDALFSQVPDIHKDIGAVVFTDGEGFDSFYPFASKAHYPDKLMSFIHDFGVPKVLVTDGASEMQKGKGREIANEYRSKLKVTVPYSPWQNKAETTVRELKRFTRRKIHQKRAPRRLWSYAGKWGAALRRLTALDIPGLEGRTPYERVTGSTPNITPYAMFEWYEPVYFHQPVAGYPHQKRELGRVIGVADNCTDELAYVILTRTGKVQVRKSIWAIEPHKFNDLSVQADLLEFDHLIDTKYGDKTLNLNREGRVRATDLPDEPSIEDLPPPPPDLFDGDQEDPLEPIEPNVHSKEADEFTPEAMDEYLTAELLLPHGDTMQRARVIRRHKDEDGFPIGKRNDNPILDSRLYDIEFPDGSTDTVTTNLIAENLYSQVDDEGYHHQILKEITGCKFTDEATKKEDGYITTASGQTRPVITTKGCLMEATFTDGSAGWVPLKDLKVSNPVEVAEYAVAHDLDQMPCFKWWVRSVLRKRDRIIKKVKTRYWKRTHKFGIELPNSVEEALAIDRKTGTDFWEKAIAKEMKNVMVAFEFPEDGKIPPGFKEIKCHMVFDIKSTLQRKARFVAGGHMTDPPKESVFSSVVSRDSVRIGFTYAALNGLQVLAADVQNAYLNAPTKEKIWFKAGLEFGKERAGHPVLVVRALYGLKSSGARWRDHMAATLREGGYKSSLADPDVWMKKNTKPDGPSTGSTSSVM